MASQQRARLAEHCSSERDRKQTLWSFTLGQNIGERGNVTFNIQYDEDDGLRSRERAISANDNPARSAYVPQGQFFPNSSGDDDYYGSDWTYDANNQLKQGFVTSVDGFNRNAERYISVPLERKLWTLLAHYDITERTQIFFEGGYSDMDSRSSLEPLATDNSEAILPDGDPELLPFNRIEAYLYHDLQLRMNRGVEEQYGIYLGVDNLFDKKPPVINQLMASHITGTETAADTYDPIGRFINGGVQLEF